MVYSSDQQKAKRLVSTKYAYSKIFSSMQLEQIANKMPTHTMSLHEETSFTFYMRGFEGFVLRFAGNKWRYDALPLRGSSVIV